MSFHGIAECRGRIFITPKLMDGIDKMMTIEHIYYNWGQVAEGESFDLRFVFACVRLLQLKLFSEFETCKKGIWIQIKKDDAFRGDGIGDCLEGGNKKKDCFYLLLSGLGTSHAAAEDEVEAGLQIISQIIHIKCN